MSRPPHIITSITFPLVHFPEVQPSHEMVRGGRGERGSPAIAVAL